MTTTTSATARRIPPRSTDRSAGLAPARSAGRRVTGVAAAVGFVASAAVLLLHLVAPDVLAHAGLAIALTGVVLGMPHGAVDHMVPFWLTGTRPAARVLTRVVASYVVVAAVAATALVLWPRVAVVVFLLVSAWHFGRGEVAFAAERAGRPVPLGTRGLATAVVHGAVVVVLPLTLWHGESASLLDVLAPGLGRPVPSAVLGLVAAVVAGVALVVAARSWWHGHRLEAVELLLVLAVFVVVPPLVAFGVYFGTWHAVRHTGRLLVLPGPDGPLPVGAAVRRYLLHAALPTAVALGALAVVTGLFRGPSLPVAIAVLLALTFPHLQTVARLDRALGRR